MAEEAQHYMAAAAAAAAFSSAPVEAAATPEEVAAALSAAAPGGVLRFGPFKLDPRQVFLVSRSGLSAALVNLKPLVPGHVLVIPTRPHGGGPGSPGGKDVGRYADLTREEAEDLWDTVRQVQRLVLPCYAAPASQIGLQDGPDSGQSVPHVHVHILPVGGGALRMPPSRQLTTTSHHEPARPFLVEVAEAPWSRL